MLVDFADRSCCRLTAVVLTRCMWPGLHVPTLAGVKGHEQESRCQVPFRKCLVFFSSKTFPGKEASVGLRRCEGEYSTREGERLVPLRIVDPSQKRRRKTTLHCNLV